MRSLELPEGSVVLTKDEAAELLDRLYQVRCGCEDLATAVGEGASLDELIALSAGLVAAARDSERLR